MKLPSIFSCAVLVLLLLASSSATASALQNQAVKEQELSEALRADSSVIVTGGTNDFTFALGARNRIHRQLAIQDGFDDPILMNGFQDYNYNPARGGFINNLARGGLMSNVPIRRQVDQQQRVYRGQFTFLAGCLTQGIYACRKQVRKSHPQMASRHCLLSRLFCSFPWHPEWGLNPHSANAEGF